MTDRAAPEPTSEGADPTGPADAGTPGSARSRRAYRAAFILTLILIAVTLVALPVALRSMVNTLFGATEDVVFSLKSGDAVSGTVVQAPPADRTFLNIEITEIDEGSSAASLVASGHRECTGECPDLTFYLISLAADAGRSGMSPFAEVQVRDPTAGFTQPLQLPIDGNPSLYPFDVYDLQLGVSGVAINAAGTPTPLTPENFSDKLVVTIQDQVAEFTMEPPVDLALPDAAEADEYLDGIAGQDLLFRRPTYLQMLTVMLITLIGISGGLSLLTRSIDDLLIGVGGLILGVWGVRSVLMPQPMPTLSLVEIALSSVILMILLGLSVRTAIYFFHKSEIVGRPPPVPPA